MCLYNFTNYKSTIGNQKYKQIYALNIQIKKPKMNLYTHILTCLLFFPNWNYFDSIYDLYLQCYIIDNNNPIVIVSYV